MKILVTSIFCIVQQFFCRRPLLQGCCDYVMKSCLCSRIVLFVVCFCHHRHRKYLKFYYISVITEEIHKMEIFKSNLEKFSTIEQGNLYNMSSIFDRVKACQCNQESLEAWIFAEITEIGCLVGKNSLLSPKMGGLFLNYDNI